MRPGLLIATALCAAALFAPSTPPAAAHGCEATLDGDKYQLSDRRKISCSAARRVFLFRPHGSPWRCTKARRGTCRNGRKSFRFRPD